MSEAHLAFLASMPRDYWVVKSPWANRRMCFFIEIVLGWFSVMMVLENSSSREQFLAKYDLPDNTDTLLPKTVSDYDNLEIAFGRKPKPKITKPNELKNIHRPH